MNRAYFFTLFVLTGALLVIRQAQGGASGFDYNTPEDELLEVLNTRSNRYFLSIILVSIAQTILINQRTRKSRIFCMHLSINQPYR